jgi:hypothetical protein
LDQIVISYWFNGPEDMQDQDASGNVSAELAAAQFRLACSDASPAVGAWLTALCQRVALLFCQI